jgi:hypothetical protein
VLAVKSAELAKEPLARFGAKGDVREVDLFPPGAASVSLRDVKPMVLFNLAGYGVARDQRDGKAMWRDGVVPGGSGPSTISKPPPERVGPASTQIGRSA